MSDEKFDNKIQPRIVAVNIAMDIFPKELDFKAEGTYIMVNKSSEKIDSILLNHNNYPSTFTFNKKNALVLEDTIHNFDIYKILLMLY